MRVLYVCPWAHWASHNPHFVAKESAALTGAGIELSLCTFQGVLDNRVCSSIVHKKVTAAWYGYPLGLLSRLLHLSMKLRMIAGFLEHSATLWLAVRLRKSLSYDVIYLRDGDPFIFLPILFGLVFRGRKWIISIIGTKSVRSPEVLYYRFINAGIWKWIYRRSLSKNRFIFVCENDDIKDHFKNRFLDGLLDDRVKVISPGILPNSENCSKMEARDYLGLPQDKSIFLHFGALHQGKNIEAVVAAFHDIENAVLVIAGKVTTDSLDLAAFVKRCGIEDKCIIRDFYIPEAEKQYYFAAADAIILSYRKSFSQTASQAWEAAGFRLPVIASGSCNLGEMVRNNHLGLVFSAEDALSLNEAIKNFIGLSHDKKKNFEDSCSDLCTQFSMDRWTQDFIKVAQEIEN